MTDLLSGLLLRLYNQSVFDTHGIVLQAFSSPESHLQAVGAPCAQDWSCTATTLSLFDWFKLEDIRTSLYFVAVTRVGRERRRLGERQPRYLKFLQVTGGSRSWCLLLGGARGGSLFQAGKKPSGAFCVRLPSGC